MPELTIREIKVGTEDYDAALSLRDAVLRAPLGLAWTEEEFANEARCFHVVAFVEQKLVAVLLLMPESAGRIRMRQVAVAPEVQREGIGKRLIAYAETLASQRGFTVMTAHARESAFEFYLRQGYRQVGAPFLEVSLPHREVVKPLPSPEVTGDL